MKDQRGVVYLETLIAFLPVFLFFLGTLQIADAGAAHLIVKHAATVAARAAVVVLPDDGVYYNDQDNAQIHQFAGLRRDDIEHAADLVLAANARLEGTADNVSIGFSAQPEATPAGETDAEKSSNFGQRLLSGSNNRGNGEQGMRELVTARVNARYTCLVAALCSRGLNMVSEASLVYQGARYIYEARTNGVRNAARSHNTNGGLVDQANQNSDPNQNSGVGTPGAPNNDGRPSDPIANNGGRNPSTPASGSSTQNPGDPIASNNPPNNSSSAGNRPGSGNTGSASNGTNPSRPPVVARPPTDDPSATASSNRPTPPSIDNRSSDRPPPVGAAPPSDSDSPRASVPSRSDPGTPSSPQSIVSGRATESASSSNRSVNGRNDGGSRSPADIVAGSDTGPRNASSSARTTPRNERELRAALPPNLRNVPIVRDPTLQGSTVRVSYTHNDRGVITGIEVRVGDGAQARHVADHASTVATMQRYQGLSGRTRALLNRVQGWFSRNPNARPGSRAWETRREIEKLSGIVNARTRALEDGALSDEDRAELERELSSYEQQLAGHQADLDRYTNEPGRGYVAAEDNSSDPIADFFEDKRDDQLNATNAESPSHPPADLASRIAAARARAAHAETQHSDGSTYAEGAHGTLNGWSHQDGASLHRDDLTALNAQYSAQELGLDQPGGRNDPRHDHGALGSRRRDNKHLPLVHGGAASSHAEQLVAVADGLNGSNGPIGVSRQQCGACRRWFREHAQQQQQTFVVADPKYTRVYYPNGQVQIYDASRTLLQTVDAGTDPSATISNYTDKEW